MQSEQAQLSSILGVDIGGTFTDIVYYTPPPSIHSVGQLTVHKVPSTPKNPAQGLLAGMQDLKVVSDCVVIHGSTVATNALLERKGARAALVTTEGFADVLEIGHQDRPALYDIMQQRPPVLIPSERRLELPERLDYRGTILRAPTPDEYEKLVQQLMDCEPESIAISLLYAFRNPRHEQALAELLRVRIPEAYLSLASEILPQFREYERTSTVAVNAYVQPLMARYLNHLQEHIQGPLRIMQSSGGSISAVVAAQEPVRTVLSGPAGGVIGAFHIAKIAGHEHIITLDMGGTSTDVALCAGSITETTEAVIAGCPIGVPTVAIHTVGAGGGSIVRLDEGNALNVGPDSAGADPGPACYGKGDALTVTDANLVLGRIDPAYFLGGRFTLYPERAFERMAELAQKMGVSVQEAALGIIRVVNASMERAIRTVSLEKGYDPRLFTLLPFGGAGPLHACELAEALRIPRICIPRYPGVLSAPGMVLAPIVKDYVQMELPLRVRRYALRHGSGGAGRYRGGDGLCRELLFLAPAIVTLLTERRKCAPYGLHGGEPGTVGNNSLERDGTIIRLPGKVTYDARVGDVLCICTPGGGGYFPSAPIRLANDATRLLLRSQARRKEKEK